MISSVTWYLSQFNFTMRVIMKRKIKQFLENIRHEMKSELIEFQHNHDQINDIQFGLQQGQEALQHLWNNNHLGDTHTYDVLDELSGVAIEYIETAFH